MSYTGWDGTTKTEPTVTDGVYQIGTPEELAWFAAQVNDGTGAAYNAVLTADIDLNNKEWTPIGNKGKQYNGTFDGADYTVSGLYITTANTTQPYYGLFGYTASSASISNVTVSGSITLNIGSTGSYPGGLVGYSDGGEIRNCVSSVDITITGISSQSGRVGGVVGFSKAANIIGCGNTGSISMSGAPGSGKSMMIGGVTGNNNKGKVDNCWNVGAVSGSTSDFGNLYVGGICGQNMATGPDAPNVNNCYNAGTITGEKTTSQNVTISCGGICGHLATDAYPTNCYYLAGSSTVGCSKSGSAVADGTTGIISMSEADMKASAFVTTLNGKDSLLDYTVTWSADASNYPAVSAVEIATGIRSFTLAGVAGIIDQSTRKITLELPAGMDVTSLTPTIECYGGETASPTEPQNFTNPVEYTVANLIYTVYVTVPVSEFQGSGTETEPYLIPDAAALTKMSELYNDDTATYGDKFWKQTADIDMTGVYFTPIGKNADTMFTGTFDGGGFAIKNLSISYSAGSAGLFGTIGDATIKNVTLADSCIVTGSTVSVGGIVGVMQLGKTSRIENCTNYAVVTNQSPLSEGSPTAHVGGIVGSNTQTNGLIIGCKNYGMVSQATAAPYYAGGIISNNGNGTPIVDCHNYGVVTAPSAAGWSGGTNGSRAGGIAASSNGNIVGCSNEGTVSAGSYIGGIIGNISRAMVEGCYNTGTVIGISTDVSSCRIGGIVGAFNGTYLNDCYNAGLITPPKDVADINSGSIAGRTGNATLEIRNNFFIGTDITEAFGADQLGNAEATPLNPEALKSAATVAALNDYPEPWSLYKTTWVEDSGSTNGGYPIIQSVTVIPSFYAEIKSFSVTAAGTTYNAAIDGTEISIVLPYGTTMVEPTVKISDKATASPASGMSIDLSSGPATYTVTAENGKQVVYTVNAMIPTSLNGLAALRLYTTGGDILAVSNFLQDTLTYTVSLDDNRIVRSKSGNTRLNISAIPAESGAAMTVSLNGGTAKNIRAASDTGSSGGYLDLWGPSLADPIHPGENTVTLTVTPPAGGSGTATTYTLKLTVVPTLANLSFSDGDSAVALTLTPSFDPAVTDYTLDVPEGTTNLSISTEAYLPNIEDVILPVGCTDGKLAISGTGFDIQVGKGEAVTTYHFSYDRLLSYKAGVVLTPADAVIAINDPNGNYVRPEADGSYKLTVGYTYTYTVAKVGYVTATGSFTHDSVAEYTLTVALSEVSGGTSILDSDWPDLRGNVQNLGITAAYTAKTAEETELLWAVTLGTGFTNAPSIPILVDGKLIVMSGNKLLKLSLEDGSILQSVDMVKVIDWGYTPATYADGMIFAPLTDGTVQAFDAETLESLWVYSDPLKGQSVSPIYYYDGYVYTGFWNSELHDAAYVCLPATDEDPTSPNETKAAPWRDVHTGGFYWAGAVAVGDYLVYGSDDGIREGQNGTATLYSRNRITGVLCGTAELVGDQRSSIAYADGKLYFTTKKGNLYQASLNADGSFAPLKVYQMDGMATGTPVVYDGLVFANSLDGTNQFGDPGATYVLNAADLSLVTKAQNKFYNQSSLLLSTAYAEDGKLYLYGTYNGVPGGMEVLVYDTSAKTLTVEDFFIPDSDKQEYGICSPICDANGTIYYKNDSANIFAIANKNADALVAKAADELIEGIGTVTLESAGKINAARAAYDALTDAQKALTTKLAVLLAAEAKYAELAADAQQADIDAAAAKGTDDLIEAIGSVTLESEQAITAARNAYTALTAAQQALVTKLDVLTAAEAKLAELKADKAAAEAVEEKITAIGTVTLESESAITEARAAYDALTDAQKALVSSLSVLTAAEAKLQELKNSGSGSSGNEKKKLHVTMRLIGAEVAAKDVDLCAEAYLPNYVTWIPTTAYELEEGAKVYDLWVMATSEWGISSIGAERNYVSTVYAPSGYELSEFTNGRKSGWMYTINGSHPGYGLKEQKLSDGDVVIWHYINDYSYECADWFNEAQWPSLATDSRYYNLWLQAPDYQGGVGGGIGGSGSGSSGSGSGESGTGEGEIEEENTVIVPAEVEGGEAKAEVAAEAITEALENTEEEVLTVKVDTENAESVESVELTLSAEAIQAAAEAEVDLHIETEQGTVKLDAGTLSELAESGAEIAVTVTASEDGSFTLDVTADGETVDATVKVELPATEDSQVLVIVNADGTEEVIKKSLVEDGKVYAELPAGATVKVVENSKDFDDVAESAWYAEAVDFASSHELFQGVAEGEFAPQNNMTRAMLVTVLFRLEDEPESAGSLEFPDVADGAWYAEAVAWAAETELVNGTDKGFEPNENVSREQIATILYRYVKSQGLVAEAKGDVSKFSDGDEVSDWAAEAMAWAVDVGLFQGDGNKLDPKGDATRAEVATLMQRLVKLLVK